MFVAAGPLVTMATPGRPVAWAYPSAMCPAPCSWRTRMWRIDESMSGSYTGRIAPPGRPNMTSTPSISRLRISAWAPVSFMGAPGESPDLHQSGREKPPACARGQAYGRGEAVRLGDYYDEVGGLVHEVESIVRSAARIKSFSDRPARSPGIRRLPGRSVHDSSARRS